MKKLYIIFAFVLLTSLSKATTHYIGALTSSFFPAATTAKCNDTIIWALTNLNESHTTTSTSVPSGATAWNASLNATSATYSIVLTVPGTYSYQCTFHVSMGMKGTITVTCPNGVPSVNNNYYSAAYPIPFSSKLTIETTNGDMIAFYNMVGEKIKTIGLQGGMTKTEVNLADLTDGVYFYCILREGVVVETKKIVKN